MGTVILWVLSLNLTKMSIWKEGGLGVRGARVKGVKGVRGGGERGERAQK